MKALMKLHMKLRNGVSLWRDERGLGTLEIVMIAAVLIAIVLVFRKEIIGFLEDLVDRVTSESDSLFS